MFNGCAFNGGALNGPSLHLAAESPVPRWARYHLKVYNPAGQFQAYIDQYDRESSWEETANAADALNLTMSPKHAAATGGYLTRPNEVRLYDSSWRWLRSFLIMNTTYRRESGARALEVSCKGMLALIEKQTIATYTADTPVKIIEHLAAWFAGTGITIGYIDTSIANKKVTVGKLTNTPLTQAVERLRDAAGGFYSLDKLRNFNWYALQSGAARQILHIGSSVVSFEENIDRYVLANTVTVIGGINATTKNTIVATATDAASVTTYGPHPKTITNRAILTQTLAQEVADKELSTVSAGKVERKIGAIDLSQVPNTFGALAARPTALFPGLPVKIVPPVDAILPSLFETSVLRVRRPLGNPAAAEIEVGTVVRKNWIDMLLDKQKEAEEDKREDTAEDEKIYDAIEDLADDVADMAHAPMAFTDLTDVPNSYVDQAFKVPYVNEAEDGLEFAHVGSFLSYGTYDALLEAGIPTVKPIWAEVQSDGQKTGLWYYPSGGIFAADWIQVWPWYREAENLQALGNGIDYDILEPKVVFIPDGFDKAGMWYKPYGAEVEAECIPMNAVRGFDESP